MAQQGCAFSEQEVQRIVILLSTDMTASQIAERMHCSRSTVIAINRKFKVRDYAGGRSTWETREVVVDRAARNLNGATPA